MKQNPSFFERNHILDIIGKYLVFPGYTSSVAIGFVGCFLGMTHAKSAGMTVFCVIIQCGLLFSVWVSVKMFWLLFKDDDLTIGDVLDAIEYKVKAFKAHNLKHAPLYINDIDLRIKAIAKQTLKGST